MNIKKNRIKIVFLAVLIVIGCFFVKKFFTNIKDYSVKQYDKTLDSKDKLKDEKSIINNKDNNKERLITKPILDSIERKARKEISNFNFLKANDFIDESLSQYNIDSLSNFENFEKMYFDLPVMCQFKLLNEHEENEQIRKLIRDLQDAENFFISIMWLDRKEREFFIYTRNSINPVFNGEIEVLNKQKIKYNKEEVLNGIDKTFSNIEEVIEIEFRIENNDLIAYIAKTKEGLKFYKIVEKYEGATYYYTIEEWEEKYKDINKRLNK